MTKIRPDVFAQACPSRLLLARIANKWAMLVIDALGEDSVRNGALLRRVEGVSQKMLTETLRELEALRLVERRSLGSVPPHVEYRLTALGLSLREAVCRLDRWVEEHMEGMAPEAAVLEGARPEV